MRFLIVFLCMWFSLGDSSEHDTGNVTYHGKFRKSLLRDMANLADPLSVRIPWTSHIWNLLEVAWDPSVLPNLCSSKFVLFPREECHFRFGNLIHVHTNMFVVASLLERYIVFSSSAKDCVYLDRPDSRNDQEGFSVTWSRLCPNTLLSFEQYRDYYPPENAWALRCNRTYEKFSTVGKLEIFKMEHQNAGALFQNPMVQEQFHGLPYPTNFDDETDLLQRYEIFGVIFKLVFPLNEEVTDYTILPSPNGFDLVLGVHLRHFFDKRLHHAFDQVSCLRIKSLFEDILNSENCAWLIATEHEQSETLLQNCAREIGCTPLILSMSSRRSLRDEGALGRLVALASMHALSVHSTHLITTAESSFSKLIAERWVANKGVSASLGKWWTMPRDTTNKIYRPHKFNFERWESGHPKLRYSTEC